MTHRADRPLESLASTLTSATADGVGADTGRYLLLLDLERAYVQCDVRKIVYADSQLVVQIGEAEDVWTGFQIAVEQGSLRRLVGGAVGSNHSRWPAVHRERNATVVCVLISKEPNVCAWDQEIQ